MGNAMRTRTTPRGALVVLPVLLGLLVLAGCSGGTADQGQGGDAGNGDRAASGASADSDGHNHEIEVSFARDSVGFQNAGDPVEVPMDIAAAQGTALEEVEVKVEGLPEYVKWEATQPEVSADGRKATGVVSFTLASSSAPRGDFDAVVNVSSGGASGHGSLKVHVTATSCA